MSWYTYCNANLMFNKKSYSTKESVMSDIKDLKDEISHDEKVLLGLISLNKNDNEEDILNKSMNLVDSMESVMNKIIEDNIEVYKLECLLEFFYTRSGDYVVNDEYYKCAKDQFPVPIRKDVIYRVNVRDYCNRKIYYIIDDNHNVVEFEEKYFKNNFVKSTQKEFEEKY